MKLERTGLPIAILLLGAAVVFHALMPRYEFANLNGAQVTRRDRWTGKLEVCTATSPRAHEGASYIGAHCLPAVSGR